MRLLLIRHAPTAETGSVLSGRKAGIGLSPDGKAMAEDLAASLTGMTAAAIYTSPIQRCRETAAPLAKSWRLRTRVERGLTETDFGQWTGRKLSSLYKLKAWRGLFIAPSRFRFPGGETFPEVQIRAVSAVERMVNDHADSVVAAVSHADVIRCILAHYVGAPLDMIHRLDVSPGSVSVVELSRRGPPRVPVINQVTSLARWQ